MQTQAERTATRIRWALANPEKVKAAQQRYKLANREKLTARARRYQKANPEKVLADVRRRRAFRNVFLDRWKLAAGCIDCGYNADACALDFDHVVMPKSFGLSSGRMRAWPKVLAEIEKCVVRCANCHRIATKRWRES